MSEFHVSITEANINEVAHRSVMGPYDLGICTHCGNEQATEPDAVDIPCDDCEHDTVTSVYVLGGLFLPKCLALLSEKFKKQ